MASPLRSVRGAESRRAARLVGERSVPADLFPRGRAPRTGVIAALVRRCYGPRRRRDGARLALVKEWMPFRRAVAWSRYTRRGFATKTVWLRLLPFLAGISTASRAAEQPPLPIELPVTDSIVMTDRDELYVSPTEQYFRLPDQKRLMVPVELAYGFTDRLQLVTRVPYALVDPDAGQTTSGIGDVAVATRYSVVDYREHPFGLDVGLGLELPTGDRRRDLGDGRVALEPSFTASMWLGQVNVQANAGWIHALRNAGDEPDDEAEYNVALLHPIGRWFVVLEGNGETDRKRTTYYVTPGVVWKTTDRLELRFAVPSSVTDPAGDYGLIAGFTFEFEHVFHETEGG